MIYTPLPKNTNTRNLSRIENVARRIFGYWGGYTSGRNSQGKARNQHSVGRGAQLELPGFAEPPISVVAHLTWGCIGTKRTDDERGAWINCLASLAAGAFQVSDVGPDLSSKH